MKLIQQEHRLEKYLQTHFQYDAFHEGQKEIITSVLAGNDVLGILRTGVGKSLCYQLPAKILPGITIVVSPLISLMIDQVRECKALQFKEVAALHSFQSWEERQDTLRLLHHVKLLFVSPELLQTDRIVTRLKELQLSLFVIDEAHCISQWGYDFRPDYLRLTQVISSLGDPTVLALTGTATPEVQADMKNKLGRPTMQEHIYPMDRENISLVIEEIQGSEEAKDDRLMYYLHQYRVPTLIYFSSRMKAEQIANKIMVRSPERHVAFYHGGMDAVDRLKIQQQFMNNQLDVICCTSAFGMGINKDNIRLILHYHPPTQMESYIQEIGRAGRDGKESVSVLLYRPQDFRIPTQIIENELPTKQELDFVCQRLLEYRNQDLSIPNDEVTIEATFMIGVTKWRYLYYQLEVHHIVKQQKVIATSDQLAAARRSIDNFTQKRLADKRQKLAQMTTYLHTTTCLREKLYRPFQQTITERKVNCCSNCGFTFTDWDVQEHDMEKERQKNWQDHLKMILLIGEIH